MICNNCKAENSADTKFCRNCGKPLELSTIDRYPQLKLKPTSVYKLKPKKLLIIIHLFVLFFLFSIAWIYFGADYIGGFLTFLSLSIIYFLIFRKQIISKKINDVADYFQSTQNK